MSNRHGMSKVKSIFGEFDSLFTDIFGSREELHETREGNSRPAAPGPVKSTLNYRVEYGPSDVLLLHIDIPGVDPECLVLGTNKNKIVLKGIRDGKNFINTYTISSDYTVDGATASWCNGRLTVKVLKMPDHAVRVITIQVIK